MIGLVLVTHGHLADELISAMEHVVGPQDKVEAVCIGADDDIEQRRSDIISAVKTVSTKDGVVLVTDMFGGTPSNLAISIMGKSKLEVISGVNLPMLVKFASCRDKENLEECVIKIQESGKKYINIASRLIKANKRR
ncbi:MAG TPA: PTS sugar transporter subunit IIA [Rhodospirillales bacterium]|jgi:PTS system mannose-specific IIA component|nr:PTS sugar transporter subunit IIA [Rhodospirillales bacterium]HIL74587.1 PTS sugar transporter subunit IIA [Rhodospirillales bacterium]